MKMSVAFHSSTVDRSVVTELVFGFLKFDSIVLIAGLVAAVVFVFNLQKYMYTIIDLWLLCFRTLHKKLMSLFLKNKRDSDPSWICSIPLLHLLCKECTAFNDPLPSEYHRTDRWWGIAQLKTKVDAFKDAAPKYSDWNP